MIGNCRFELILQRRDSVIGDEKTREVDIEFDIVAWLALFSSLSTGECFMKRRAQPIDTHSIATLAYRLLHHKLE